MRELLPCHANRDQTSRLLTTIFLRKQRRLLFIMSDFRPIMRGSGALWAAKLDEFERLCDDARNVHLT